jgi:hypothetical protein
MSSLSRRIIQVLPDWAWQLIQYRPVITTYDRYARRIDEVETAAYLRGLRDHTIADLTARIDAGPPARGRHLQVVRGGAV